MYLMQLPYPDAVIWRPKGGLQHWGILLSDYRVVHCAPGRGEHISTVEEFGAGQDVGIIRRLTPADHEPTMRRIVEALRSPKPYDWLTNNCQTFANRMTGQKAESPQLQAIGVLAAVAMLVGIAAS